MVYEIDKYYKEEKANIIKSLEDVKIEDNL